MIGRRAKTSKGFTLLEVLVALAVVAVALSALLKAVSANTVNAAYLRDKAFAQWVAMNVVAEYQLGLSREDERKSSGEAEMGQRQWYWRTRRVETFDAAIERLEVEVRAEEGDETAPLASVVAFLPSAGGGGISP